MSVVRVGVGVLVKDPKNPGRVFCGMRKGSHGAGTLALPGGHLELYETWEECAVREVLEETNLAITNLQLGHVTNDPMPAESKHYVTIFMMGECEKAEENSVPRNMEPHKCEGWASFSWDELKGRQSELFGPLKRLVQEDPEKITNFLNKN